MSTTGTTRLLFGVLGLFGLALIVYVILDYGTKGARPCETIFEQTATRFDVKIKALDAEGGVVLGRQQIQELTENAQITALNLKTCCIVLESGSVNSDQFLECKNAGQSYEAKLDAVARNVADVRSARQAGDTATAEAMQRAMAATLEEARAITTELNEKVATLRQPPEPLPAPPAAPGTAAPDVTGKPMLPESPGDRPLYVGAAAPEGLAIEFSASPITSIVVKPLTRFDTPAIKEILVVEAGTELRSFKPVQRSSKFDAPMIVDPGSYDVVLKPAGQSMFRLVEGIEVAEGQKAALDPNVLVSFIVPTASSLNGLPELADFFVMPAGSELTSIFYPAQRSRQANVPMLVPAGAYDLYAEPAGRRSFRVATSISVAQGQGVEVDTNEGTAAIAFGDPHLEGFELDSIYVVAAGTDITKGFRPVQEADGFDEPMLVPANGRYDIVLKPVEGSPVKVKRDLSPPGGRVTRIDMGT